jgi:hypothetical protein
MQNLSTNPHNNVRGYQTTATRPFVIWPSWLNLAFTNPYKNP